MAQEKITQTAGHNKLGEFAPQFAHYNDDVLFGEAWNDTVLSPHDRSLVTIATLIGKGIIDSSLEHHLQFAKTNGVTRAEISAMHTHIAFYAGWPNAWGAFRIAKNVWSDDTNRTDAMAEFQRSMIFPIGEPNTEFAKYFTGNSYLARISSDQIPFANVTFEPRCRCNILKINDEELVIISRLFGYPGTDLKDKCRILLEKYNLTMLILTCGINGSYVFTPGNLTFVETPEVTVINTVGAGDSFTAAFISAIIKGCTVTEAHRLAADVSAYVCTQAGAMPILPASLTNRLKSTI